jgi:hypothetical protein
LCLSTSQAQKFSVLSLFFIAKSSAMNHKDNSVVGFTGRCAGESRFPASGSCMLAWRQRKRGSAVVTGVMGTCARDKPLKTSSLCIERRRHSDRREGAPCGRRMDCDLRSVTVRSGENGASRARFSIFTFRRVRRDRGCLMGGS